MYPENVANFMWILRRLFYPTLITTFFWDTHFLRGTKNRITQGLTVFLNHEVFEHGFKSKLMTLFWNQRVMLQKVHYLVSKKQWYDPWAWNKTLNLKKLENMEMKHILECLLCYLFGLAPKFQPIEESAKANEMRNPIYYSTYISDLQSFLSI